MPFADRQNHVRENGWVKLAGQLEGMKELEMVAGVECKGLVSGAMSKMLAAVAKDEWRTGFDRADEVPAGPALISYLPRSASCLKTLDLRLVLRRSRHVLSMGCGGLLWRKLGGVHSSAVMFACLRIQVAASHAWMKDYLTRIVAKRSINFWPEHIARTYRHPHPL